MDYDTDSDGLIEITTLAQLDAIRLRPGRRRPPHQRPRLPVRLPRRRCGQRRRNGRRRAAWAAPTATPVVRTCLGYELMGNLNFDTDGDGSTHTAGVGDPGDDYYNAGAGWAPIGGHGETTHQAFTAILDGNDNDIENLYLNLETDAANAGTYVGLFADLTGTVRNVGLAQPYVKNARSGTAAFARTGALAGRNSAGGVVRGSSVTGGSVTGDQSVVTGTPINLVGCLLGYNAGTVRDSHAGCAATATGSDETRDQAGGLVGENAAITVDSVTGAGVGARQPRHRRCDRRPEGGRFGGYQHDRGPGDRQLRHRRCDRHRTPTAAPAACWAGLLPAPMCTAATPPAMSASVAATPSRAAWWGKPTAPAPRSTTVTPPAL